MRIFYLYCCLLLGALCSVGVQAISAQGIEGGNVSIRCSHRNAWSNGKYFCSDPCTSNHVLVSVDASKKENKMRLSLNDFGNGTFVVNFSMLKKSDSGKYWCGVKRTGRDTYNEVNLDVRVATKTTPTMASSGPTPVSNISTTFLSAATFLGTSTAPLPTLVFKNRWSKTAVQYVCVGLVVTVAMTGLALLLVYKRKQKEPQVSSRTIPATADIFQEEYYETITPPLVSSSCSSHQLVSQAADNSAVGIIYDNIHCPKERRQSPTAHLPSHICSNVITDKGVSSNLPRLSQSSGVPEDVDSPYSTVQLPKGAWDPAVSSNGNKTKDYCIYSVVQPPRDPSE